MVYERWTMYYVYGLCIFDFREFLEWRNYTCMPYQISFVEYELVSRYLTKWYQILWIKTEEELFWSLSIHSLCYLHIIHAHDTLVLIGWNKVLTWNIQF